MGRSPGRAARLAALVACLAIVALSGVCAWAAAGSAGAGPEIALRVGDYHLIARTTRRPECLPLPQQQCFISFPNPSYDTPIVYGVWAGRITQVPSAGAGGTFTVSKGWHLLRLRVR